MISISENDLPIIIKCVNLISTFKVPTIPVHHCRVSSGHGNLEKPGRPGKWPFSTKNLGKTWELGIWPGNSLGNEHFKKYWGIWVS